MKIETVLNHDFVIVDLGSSSAKQNKFLKKFSPQITYIEIDALSTSTISTDKLFKNIKINKGIHAEAGVKQFIERDYLACSSFLEFKEDIPSLYGMESLTKEKNRLDIECITVNDILADNNTDHIDFLKIDLEGLDFDIIKSIENRLDKVNVIQAEIRFHPLFKGEKYFFEICQYLSDKGFEFINFSTVGEWKFNTSNMKNFRDGRLVWADFVFFRKQNQHEPGFIPNLVKQILIAKSLNFNSYAEYLLENNKTQFDQDLYREMKKQVATFSLSEIFFNNIFSFVAHSKFIYPIRKSLKYLYSRSRVHHGLENHIP